MQDTNPSISYPHVSRSTVLFILSAATLIGITLILLHDWLAQGLAWRLPDSMIPRSAGTFFPSFNSDNGFSLQLYRTGWLLIFAAAVGAVTEFTRRSWLDPISKAIESGNGYRVGLIALGASAFGVYLYFGWWPDAYPSNARIHWVDGFFDRADRHTYAMTKWVNQLFYDSPRLLVALYGFTNTLLFAGITRRLTGSKGIGLLAGLSYLIASNILLFANMAEDVNLSLVALLGCSYAYLRNVPLAFGLIGFIASMVRPTHILLFAALWGMHALHLLIIEHKEYPFRQRIHHALKNRFLLTSLLAFVLPFIAWHGWMLLNEQHFLLNTDNSTYSNLRKQQSVEIDGFQISQFSGAALFHFLWVFPLTCLAAWLASFLFLCKAGKRPAVFILSITAFTAINIFLVEYLKMYYFNIRYLSYYFPLLLASGWVFARHLPIRNVSLHAGLLVLLCLASATNYNHAFNHRERVANYPFSQLFEQRFELREMTKDCNAIYTDFTRRSQKNYLSYLMKRPAGYIRDIVNDRPDADYGCVIASISTASKLSPDGYQALTTRLALVMTQ